MRQRAAVACVVLALSACSASHSASEDAGGAADSPPDSAGGTTVTLLSRLSGATATLAGQSVELGSSTAWVTIEPKITVSSMEVSVSADGDTIAAVADWSRHLAGGGLPEGTPIDALELVITRLPDGSCGIAVDGGRAAGHVWAALRTPAGPCGPFGFEVALVAVSATCADREDCRTFRELHADGTLRVDRAGEPGVIHTVTISDADLLEAERVLTNPTLLRALELPAGDCVPRPDTYEVTRVALRLETLEKETNGCDDPYLQPMRDLLQRLEDTYVR